MKILELLFEGALWRSRYIVLFAVIASMASSFSIFFLATADVVYLLQHVSHYLDAGLSQEARSALRNDTVTHIVEVVDGYLLGAVMLIFALGMYELFVSDIDQARNSKAASKILLIESLDDLKNRLAKVILMILIVKLFEHALRLQIDTALQLLYLGASIALIGLALYLSHASEKHAPDEGREPKREEGGHA
ncbi:MAG TPA: YqhA family protein [Burkholderiales bacterium]|nr:YqhA family protein [Burkholderiales bacterium]